jgi:hypothetical protein
MKDRTHFKHRLDKLDAQGEIVEHLAGAEDFMLADAMYESFGRFLSTHCPASAGLFFAERKEPRLKRWGTFSPGPSLGSRCCPWWRGR